MGIFKQKKGTRVHSLFYCKLTSGVIPLVNSPIDALFSSSKAAATDSSVIGSPEASWRS